MRKLIFATAMLAASSAGARADTVSYVYGDIGGPIYATMDVQLSGPLPGPNPSDGYFILAEYMYFSDASGANMGNVVVADATVSNGPGGPTYQLDGAVAQGSDTLRYLHTGVEFEHAAGEPPGFGATFTLTLPDGLSFSPIAVAAPRTLHLGDDASRLLRARLSRAPPPSRGHAFSLRRHDADNIVGDPRDGNARAGDHVSRLYFQVFSDPSAIALSPLAGVVLAHVGTVTESGPTGCAILVANRPVVVGAAAPPPL